MPLLPSWPLFYAIITIMAIILCHYYQHGFYLNVMPLVSSWLLFNCFAIITNMAPIYINLRLHKPVTDWLETLPHSSDGLNM